MKLKKGLLSVIVGIAVVSFFMFLVGFVIAANDLIYPKAAQAIDVEEVPQDIIAKDGRMDIVGLGDSLTRGMGDTEGLGYIGRFTNMLKADWGQTVSLANLAVSGAKAPQLIEQLSDTGVQYSITQADLIVLTIGGNDLNPGWDQLSEIDLQQYEPDVEAFANDVRTILTTLRSYNPVADIYWLSLFNPFESITELHGSSENIVLWNTALETIALEYEDVFIIPTFDLFQTKTSKLLSKDHFHPNNEGYQSMAERLLQKVVLQLGLTKKGDRS